MGGHGAGCVRPVCLGDLQSDDAQTFLIVVGGGWHDPHRWRDQLAVSAGSGRSLDLVFDNLGFPGTADTALRAIRSGGTFLLLPGGDGGVLSNQTKSGVTQMYGRTQPAVKDLETLAQLFDLGELRPSVLETFHLD